MGLQEAAGEAVKALMPPKTNELEAQQRWRWMVFAAIIGIYVAVGTHIAIACGYFASIYPGFALASDTRAIQTRVDVIAMLSIEQEIRRKAEILCNEKDQTRRNDLNDDISKLQREYRAINGDWYKIPRCDQL